MYRKTDGEMKKMWEKKWYELVKKIGRKLDESTIKRPAADTRQVH
tara:strand:+ start:362 stop:496 length:135 start_codon:yes stop_codon:yes gene_type:complete